MHTVDTTPVLLIRGLMREQRHWGEFKPLLQAALPNPVLSLLRDFRSELASSNLIAKG